VLFAWLIERWFPDEPGAALSMLFESFVCFGVAALCGLLIGLERERSEKPAGVRTHMLVSLGAAAFVHVGVLAHRVGDLGSTADFNRLIQSVATGIGFLGAGVIFRAGWDVRGVTTAASVWVMGAVGAAAGAGALVPAALLTIFAYIVLHWLHVLDAHRKTEDDSD